MSQKFTLDIPDAAVPRIIEALIVNYGYQSKIPDPDNPGEVINNPQSHVDFAMDQVKNFLSANVRAYEAKKATDEAVASLTPLNI